MSDALPRSKRLLPGIALRALAEWNAEHPPEPVAANTAPPVPGLMDLIPRVSHGLKPPLHLARLVNAIERSRTEQVFCVVSAPPGHAKTETLLHAFAWWLLNDPTDQLAYLSHSHSFARFKSRRARTIAMLSGLTLGASKSVSDWSTEQGGGLYASGILGDIMGRRFRRVVIDDPIKGSFDANSAHMREKHYEAVSEIADTRIYPDGSVFLCMHRWHEDDVAARKIKEGWEEIRLPALSEDADETALWPESGWTQARLRRIRDTNPLAFASRFQGRPRPRGDKVFRDVHTYSELPTEGVDGHGVDLAYGAKTASDKSVLVRMRKVTPAGEDAKSKYYITKVIAKRVRVTEFLPELLKAQKERSGAKMRWYTGGQETGIADLFKDRGLNIETIAATVDKLIRATPLAEAWNEGRVLVPGPPDGVDDWVRPEWLDDYIEQMTNFTGLPGGHDDETDATAAAFDVLTTSGRTVAEMWANMGVTGIGDDD